MSPLLRLLAALHARGFHAAVIAGLVMMPAVVAAGFLTGGGGHLAAPVADFGPLRGTIAEPSPAGVRF